MSGQTACGRRWLQGGGPQLLSKHVSEALTYTLGFCRQATLQSPDDTSLQ
jgi:hypothetical protein